MYEFLAGFRSLAYLISVVCCSELDNFPQLARLQLSKETRKLLALESPPGTSRALPL